MTRLHTALSFHGAAPPAPRAGRGGAPETEERNEDSSRKPTPAGRAARPTAPPRAGAAGFGRLRAVSACSGVERVVGGCGARPGESRARRLAGARRGRAAGVRCRSRRGEPVRSREAVCRHAGQWSGGDGVPSSARSADRRSGGCARSSGAAPAAVVVSRRVPCFSDPHARTGAQALRGAPLARGLSPSPRTPYSVRTSQYTARHYNTCGDARVVHWLHAAHHACPLDCPHPWLAQTSSSLILVDVGAGFMSFMPQ